MYSAKNMKPVTTKLIIALLFVLVFSVSVVYAQQSQTQSASPIGNKDPGKNETAVGALVADAMRVKLGSNIAFVTASELKPKNEPFPAGAITSDDIAGLVSYPDDPLAMLILRGSVIRQSLEKAVSMYPQPNLGFIHVSGLDFTFDPSKKSGDRITAIRVGGTPMNDEFFYTVAVTNSLANGALGYWKVWTKDDVKQRFPDTTIKEALQDFFRANPRIDYTRLGRVTARQ